MRALIVHCGICRLLLEAKKRRAQKDTEPPRGAANESSAQRM